MNRKILSVTLSCLMLLGGCQFGGASENQTSGTWGAGEAALIVECEQAENPAWAKLMYLRDSSIESFTLDGSQTLEDLGAMMMSAEPVQVVSAGQDAVSLAAVDTPSWENAAFRPMTKEETGLLLPIYGVHQYLYHQLGQNASFLPEEELTGQQIRIYLNLTAVLLEQNPNWLVPAETAGDIRQYDGREFLKLAQSCYPGLPDNALEQLPTPDTLEDELGKVFLWYDSQWGGISAAATELGGVLPAPLVRMILRVGDRLEFTLIDYAGPICEKTFVCEKSEKGYAVKKVEIREIG